MGKVIIANQKGGGGKNHYFDQFGRIISRVGQKVLVIDADPQANASSGLGVDPRTVSVSIYECLIGGNSLREAIVGSCVSGLDIVCSRIDLVGAELELLNVEKPERVLSRLLDEVKREYGLCFDRLLSVVGFDNCQFFNRCGFGYYSVQAEYFALEGISKLLNTIKIIKSKLNPALEIEGFLLTMYDARLRLANQIYEELKKHFRDMVFTTVIQRNIRLSKLPVMGFRRYCTIRILAEVLTTCNWQKELIERES